MSNVLIAGGSGAVGQNLVEIVGEEIPIYVLDRILGKRSLPNCKYSVCELGDPNSVKSIASKLPDNLTVVYLAGHLTNSLQREDLLKGINDNIVVLANFITSTYSKFKHLIFVSSVSVYGIPKYNPIDENHPIVPFSIYGSQKACAELIAKSLCNQLEIPLTVIRASQLFGLSSAEKSLPHLLVNSLKMREMIRISCNPDCERDYLHVSDLSSFICDVVNSPKEGTFNIGSGKGIKIYDLFRISFDAFGIPFELDKVLSDQLNPSFSQIMNIQRARQAYGFKPKHELEDWFRECARDSKAC